METLNVSMKQGFSTYLKLLREKMVNRGGLIRVAMFLKKCLK